MSIFSAIRNPADIAAQAQRSESRQDAARRYAETLSDDSLADVIAEGGARWWIKPGVWEAVVQSAPTPDDWKYISYLALKADPDWANKNLPMKARNLNRVRAEQARQEYRESRADRGDDNWLDRGLERVGGAVSGAARSAVRTAAAVAESPYQEAQGLFRAAVWGAANAERSREAIRNVTGEGNVTSFKSNAQSRASTRSLLGIEGEGWVGSQSTLGITLEKLVDGGISLEDVLSGSEKALGSGWLPGGDIRVEQMERATRSASINGQSVTPGRFVANLVVEPGTLPYKVISGAVDAGSITFLDPVNPVLNAAGDAVKAARYFDASQGALFAHGRTVTENVARWLDGNSGRKFQQWLLDTDSAVDIMAGTKWNMPVDAAVRLADATDPTTVRAVLDDVLGFGMRYKPKGYWYDGLGGAWTRRADNIRWLQNMPRAGLVDRTNPDQWTRQIHDYLVNANVPADQIREITERTMRTSFDVTAQGRVVYGTKVADQYDVLTVASDAVNASLRAAGLPGKAAKKLTKHWETFEALRAYNIDAISGLERPLPSAVRAGVEVPAPTPQMIEQFLSRWVPFPDVQTLREVRTRTGLIGQAVSVGGRVPQLLDAELAVVKALDTFQKTWKPFQLLRGAYVIRVVGDEQARMASAGYSSVFSHPLSYLAVAMGDDGRVGRLLDSIPGVTTGRLGADVTGAKFTQLADDSEFASTLYRNTTDLLGQQGRRRFPGRTQLRLRGPRGTEEGAVEAWADNLRLLHDNEWTRRIAQGEPLESIKDAFWDSSYRGAILGTGGKEEMSDLARQVSSRAGADEYVDTVLAQWVDDVAQQDPRLLDVIATGKAGDLRLHSDLHVTKDGKQFLETLVEEGIGPNYVVGAPMLSGMKTAGETYDRIIEILFDWIAVRPSNWASRSPTFLQAYWDEVERALPYASPEARQKILTTAADEAKLPAARRKRLAAVADDPSRNFDIDDINLLASRGAADKTKKLLYDLSNRGQSWDALRLAAPFGEAFKEVFTTWYRLLTEKPKSLRTLQKTIEGARGAGWVRDDPTTGQQMFTIPGSAPLVEALIGIEGVDFAAPVSGLSIAGSLIPGAGPTLQWLAGTFLPDKPEFNRIRDLIFQFGGEDQGLVEAFAPNWAEKMMFWDNSPESDLAFNNAVGEMQNYLYATGEYDLQDRDDMIRLEKDAVEKAQPLYVVRGMLQFLAPSPPRQRLTISTDVGPLVTAELLDRFRTLQDEDYETAYQRFIDTYGEQALLAIVPRSESERFGLSSSSDFVDFRLENSKLFDKYPTVAGLFAPQGFGSDFTEHKRQFRAQERRALTQRERDERVNSILARLQYDAQKAKLPARPSQAQKDWLAQWRTHLIEEFPGYNPQDFEPGRIPAAVRDLRLAAAEFADLPAAKTVNRYFDLREAAVEAAGGESKLLKAKVGRPQREWLREWGDELSAQDPQFARTWDQLLSRELLDDKEVTPDG